MSERDALQQKAIRLFNEMAQLQKRAKAAVSADRKLLEARAFQISEELRTVVDQHDRLPL